MNSLHEFLLRIVIQNFSETPKRFPPIRLLLLRAPLLLPSFLPIVPKIFFPKLKILPNLQRMKCENLWTTASKFVIEFVSESGFHFRPIPELDPSWQYFVISIAFERFWLIQKFEDFYEISNTKRIERPLQKKDAKNLH